jgi:hypothetical protein
MEKDFMVCTYVSLDGLGVVVMHDGGVIVYAS